MNPICLSIKQEETGKRIKQLLQDHGYKVKDIQGAMGFETPQVVYKWLSGKSLPSLDNFVILSRLLNTSIEDILVIDGDSFLSFLLRFVEKNGFFAFVGDIPQKEEGEKIRGTSEKNKCLFEKSRFFDFELFRECFNTPEFEKVDLVYYYNVVKDWSASKGRMQKDWIAQTRNIIRADYRRGQIKYTSDSGEEKSVILGNSGLSYGDLLGVLNEDFE